MALQQPIKWHGGKHYLAPWIIDQFPANHTHYVEPYCGGGSVLLQKPYLGYSEVINDINPGLANFWRVLQSDDYFRKFKRLIEATPFSEDEFSVARIYLGSADAVVSACGFFVLARQSRQGLMKSFATMSRTRVRRDMNEQVSSWLTAIEGLPEIHERLQRVVIMNRDAISVIESQDGPETFFYLDPPYLHETRTAKDAYEHEMSFDEHVTLLKTLAAIKGKFLLSGYWSEIYGDYANVYGWKCEHKDIDNKSSSSKTKQMKTEFLWRNY